MQYSTVLLEHAVSHGMCVSSGVLSYLPCCANRGRVNKSVCKCGILSMDIRRINAKIIKKLNDL